MEGSHRETVKSAINRKQDEPFGSIIVARTILGRKATTKERQDEGIADLSSLRAFLYKGGIEKSRDSESLTWLYLLVSKTKTQNRNTRRERIYHPRTTRFLRRWILSQKIKG